jgi:hypothetical protein
VAGEKSLIALGLWAALILGPSVAIAEQDDLNADRAEEDGFAEDLNGERDSETDGDGVFSGPMERLLKSSGVARSTSLVNRKQEPSARDLQLHYDNSSEVQLKRELDKPLPAKKKFESELGDVEASIKRIENRKDEKLEKQLIEREATAVLGR